MMKALAEFVMRGRVTAIAIALLGSWVPFLSQATLGIVTLRKGWQEGLLITLWASLPAFVGLWVGQVSPPMALAAIAVFVVGYIASCTLRMTVSWPTTLMVIVVAAGVSVSALISLADDFAQQVSAFFTELMTSPDGEITDDAKAFVDSWNLVSASGLVAYWIGVSSIIGLLIARWWQSLLYNPGGFQSEFHHLRLSPVIVVLSGAAWLYCATQGDDHQFWSVLFGLPLLVAGLSMVHWLVARYKLGVQALVVLYVLLPFVPMSAVLLMFLALVDTGLDLRNKIKNDQSNDG